MGNTLPASERLHFAREIDTLFRTGRKVFAFPYRLVYQIAAESSETGGIAMMVVVPKRLYKHAVDRNRNKRQMRAAFRLHVHNLRSLAVQKRVRVRMAFLLTTHQQVDWKAKQTAIQKLLTKLSHEIEKR